MATFDLGTYGAEIIIDDSKFTKGMDNAEKSLGKTDSKAKKFGSGLGKLAIGSVAGLGAALLGVGTVGTKMAMDLQGSLNSLKVATGATDDEMKDMESSLSNLYNSGFGESFQDIADSMANIRQTTGLAGQELEDATRNAISFSDSFGIDVSESARAANSLIKNFGLSADEAYNLMAQGAQNGANANGDMVDVLSEYAPQYKALGFSAEEFTNTLIDGAENGVFSIDKVGDAFKEFNIRAKDGSDASAEAFQTLGLNAEEMTSSFAAGGDKAQTAFQQVMQGLNDIEDPVARNQAGVALFGTMFEDLEGDAISAFSSIGTEASLSKDALGQINEIKFNSFGEALQVIGRNFKTALIEPIQTHVLPLLSQFAQWTVENMPAIQETMGTVFGIIGTLIGGLITGVQNLIVMLQTWFTNNQTIIESIKMGFTTLVEIVSGLIQQFVTFFQTKISEILSWWNTNGAMIVQAFKNVFNVIKTVIKVALAIALPIVQGFISGIKNIISGGLNFIMGLITAFSGLFTGNWGKMWSGLKQMVSGALQAIWGFFQTNLMGRVVGLIGGFASRAVGLFRGFGSNVSGIVSSVVSKVVGFFGNLVSRIQSRVKSGFNSVKDFIVKPIEKARDLIRAAVDKIIGFFTGIGKKLKIDIPKPKLPRFSLNGKFSLKPPSVPKIGLEWHKNGGFFDQPTIAGLGEAGKEAIVPLVGNQMNPFADAVAQRMDNKTQTNNNQNVTVSPVFNYTVNGKVDEKELKRHADYTTKQINKELKDLGLKF